LFFNGRLSGETILPLHNEKALKCLVSRMIKLVRGSAEYYCWRIRTSAAAVRRLNHFKKEKDLSSNRVIL
jgi:hypothetical protein